MYVFIFLMLLIFTLISFVRKKHDFLYKILMISLTLLLCLRYGQGSDYFAYDYFYRAFSTFDGAIKNYYELNCEIGFRLLCSLFGELHLNFTAFIFCVSLFQMAMLHRFLSKFSENRIFSLLLFFPTFYLTYYFSGMRQGITLSLFIGILYGFIEKKQWKRYIIGCLLISTIHTAAIVLIVVPLVLKFKLKSIMVLNLISLVVGIVLATGLLNEFLAKIPVIGSKMLPYLENSISIFALLERVVSYTVIGILYLNSSASERAVRLMKIYSFGMVIYLAFLPFSLISSRAIIYFKILEVIIVPLLIEKKNSFRIIAITFFVLLSSFMTFKNLNSYVEQGSYYANINAFNYPYISVFEKDEIWDYRSYSPYLGMQVGS